MTRPVRLLALLGALVVAAVLGMSPASARPLTTDALSTESTMTYAGSRLAWSQVWMYRPNTAQWNLPDDARVGRTNDGVTNDVARSLFRMDLSGVAGQQVVYASFVAYETWAWSCQARPVQVWRTGPITSSTTWNTAQWQTPLATVNVAKGNTILGCAPPGPVQFNVTTAVQQAVASGQTIITLGLRAQDEADVYGWKRFRNNPTLVVTYAVADGGGGSSPDM